jgi:Flp pilus assembly protein TadD
MIKLSKICSVRATKIRVLHPKQVLRKTHYMPWKQKLCIAVLATAVVPQVGLAGDLRIALPKRSKMTPVQELNREGVEALRKNQFAKARSLFYKAYLYDPDDPFTLNNLGYISELEGQVDRAQKFYEQAGQGASEAIIDRASTKAVEGKTVAQVANSIEDKTMQVNRQNVEAIRLMSQGRAPEAELLLRGTLAMQPGNPFTLNNYAVAKEMEGDYEEALKYYNAAAQTASDEPIIVTLNNSWRGKPVHQLAADSANKLTERMQGEQSVAAQVGRLNLRGVSALNRNAVYDARKYFEQAYKLDPSNAFALNNQGYVSEMDGDSESAQMYYGKARRSEQANTRVGFATTQTAEGKKLFEVAEDNNQKMETKMAQIQEARRRRQTGPVVLKRRDNTPVIPPPTQAQPQQQPTLGPPQPQVPQLTPTPRQQQVPPPQNNPAQPQ